MGFVQPAVVKSLTSFFKSSGRSCPSPTLTKGEAAQPSIRLLASLASHLATDPQTSEDEHSPTHTQTGPTPKDQLGSSLDVTHLRLPTLGLYSVSNGHLQNHLPQTDNLLLLHPFCAFSIQSLMPGKGLLSYGPPLPH